MSTAGKVLVVLVLLMVPVWVLLASAVAQLNSAWGQSLAQQRDQVAKLEQDVLKNERAIQELTDKISLGQDERANNETVLLSRIFDVERSKAEVVKIQAAIKVQLDTLALAVKNAELARDQRLAEKENETKGKANAEQLVTEVSGQNAELMDQLTQLRNDFKSILESNKAMVDRMLKTRTTRTARPASYVP